MKNFKAHHLFMWTGLALSVWAFSLSDDVLCTIAGYQRFSVIMAFAYVCWCMGYERRTAMDDNFTRFTAWFGVMCTGANLVDELRDKNTERYVTEYRIACITMIVGIFIYSMKRR